MSRSITALGQHKLPFRDRKKMMIEIANRFEANVYLGFHDSYDLVKNELPSFKSRGIINPEEGHINGELYLLEEVHFSKEAPPFILIENDYIYQWMLEKHGEKAGYQKEFISSWTDDPIENNQIIKEFSKDFKLIDFYFKGISGILSLESADVGLDEYFTDWTNFFYLITHTHSELSVDFYKRLLEYRNTNRETILKLGGNCIYYHDDQGNNTGGAVQGNEWEMSWNEIESSFNHPDAKKYQINLCEALTNEEYLEKIQYLINGNFHNYSVFFDDFRELTWDDIIKP